MAWVFLSYFFSKFTIIFSCLFLVYLLKRIHDERNTAKGENAMTTAPYLVIGTSPFNGMDTVDECDSLEEAREFANEHGGKVVKTSEYHPKGLLEDWFNNEPEDFGVLPGIDFPATLHHTW